MDIEFIGEGVASNYTARHSLPITVQGAKLNLLWETGNKANQIFDPTRKDDKSGNGYQEYDSATEALYGIQRNHLYLVGDETDGKFKISLDLDIQPVQDRDKYVCAAFDQNGNKINGSDTAVSANSSTPITMEIPAPSTAEVVTYEIRAGKDLNENGLLEDDESSPLFVYTCPKDDKNTFSGQPRYATIKGITKEKYAAHQSEINGKVHLPLGFDSPPLLIAPHARSFLALFYYNGDRTKLHDNLRPSAPTPVVFSAFADATGYAEWLTHNSGADFDDNGNATIQEFCWDAQTKVAKFFADRKPFALQTFVASPSPIVGGYYVQTATGAKLQAFYNTNVRPLAEAELENAAVGTTATFGWYDMPHTDVPDLFKSDSPEWVPHHTIVIGEDDNYGGFSALLNQVIAGTDAFDNFDAFGAIGRGRVINPSYQFAVTKEKRFPWSNPRLVVTAVNFLCTLEDLYDFNYGDGELPSHAAALQIGYGKGTSGADRSSRGKIYRHRIMIEHSYHRPFPYPQP